MDAEEDVQFDVPSTIVSVEAVLASSCQRARNHAQGPAAPPEFSPLSAIASKKVVPCRRRISSLTHHRHSQKGGGGLPLQGWQSS